MAEPLKNIYSKAFFENLMNSIQQVIPTFDDKAFLAQLFDATWEQRELKQRMRHISTTLEMHLKGDYKTQVNSLLKIMQQLEKEEVKVASFEWMFFPDFVECFGLKDYETSIEAIEKITQFVTAEFAIRPYILQQPDRTIKMMKKWAKHKHWGVRRLATEGCRPRLPWAMALPFLKKNPAPILSILEKLKNDSSESVRRSVANNLNDIAKDNPLVVIDLVKKWKGESPEVNWVVKHASRTLLKQGNQEMMRLFGFGSVEDITIANFKIQTPIVYIGDYFSFHFDLINKSSNTTKIRLEYGLYYQKANGTLSRKVFSISEKEYAGNSTTNIQRRQPFKVITTRKFHVGLHQVALIINGVELEKYDFKLAINYAAPKSKVSKCKNGS